MNNYFSISRQSWNIVKVESRVSSVEKGHTEGLVFSDGEIIIQLKFRKLQLPLEYEKTRRHEDETIVDFYRERKKISYSCLI